MRNCNDIGPRVHHLSRMIKNSLNQNFSQYGVTGEQARVLGFISQRLENGIVYQKDVEEAFKVKRSSVTSILQNLEKLGLIEREMLTHNLRTKTIRLTKKGNDVQQFVEEQIDKLEKKLINSFSKEEVAQLIVLIEKMLRNIEVEEC